MQKDLKNLSMIEVAEQLMVEKKQPENIRSLITEVAQLKGISTGDFDTLTQLYIDIISSAKFVFCGDDLWDLKDRNLEYWDKDGSFFNVAGADEEEDEDDGITADDYKVEEEKKPPKKRAAAIVEEEDEEEIIVADEEDDYFDYDEEDEEPVETDDEEDEEDEDPFGIELISVDDEAEPEAEDFMDEEEYNEIMDDYEDMYDK